MSTGELLTPRQSQKMVFNLIPPADRTLCREMRREHFKAKWTRSPDVLTRLLNTPQARPRSRTPPRPLRRVRSKRSPSEISLSPGGATGSTP